VYIFGEPGWEKVFISSSDWMSRNLDNRVEVTVPIYDEDIKKEILETHEIAWNDNVKARVLNKEMDNRYKNDGKPPIRSQFATYDYYVNKVSDI